MILPLTCAHNEHVGAATVASTWRDTLGHHLGPSLQLQGLGVTRDWGAAGSRGHGQPPYADILAVQLHPRHAVLHAIPQPCHWTPSHHRASLVLFPGTTGLPRLSLLPEPQATPSPACWLGRTPSPSQSSPANASELRTRLLGAPAPGPVPPGSHPIVHLAPPGTCADYPSQGSPLGPQC